MSTSRISRFPAAGALLLAVSLVAAGCQSDDGGEDAAPPSSSPSSGTTPSSGASTAPGEDSTAALPAALTGQKIDWKSCTAPTPIQGSGQKPQALDGAQWECGEMKAPLDYAKPSGGTLGIALIRVKAASEGDRIGSLVFNFGGPGGSGVATLPAFASSEYKDLHKRYDLVSFDPRGVGESDGVRCLDDAALDRQYGEDATPDTAAERASYVKDLRTFADECERKSAALLPHVDTRSAARDMDLMRHVLGDDKLNYFGVSYGTELGGVYAHLFPKRVGRTVLDAVVDPTENTEQGSLGQAKGFELALGNFLDYCDKSGKCPVDGADDVAALLKRLDSDPLPTGESRELTEAYGTTGVIAALYSKETWPYLQLALKDALDGNGALLLAFADSYASRDDQGRYANILPANAAINCADTSDRYTAKDVEALLPRFREAAPTFGASLAWGMLQCTGWPVKGHAETVDVDAKGAGPIVVIGNTGDPATPYEGSVKMAEGLGKGVGVRLTVKGEGHGTYAVSSCVTKAVDGYLLDGKVPADGTTCDE